MRALCTGLALAGLILLTRADERIISDVDWIAMNQQGIAGFFPGNISIMAAHGSTVYYGVEVPAWAGSTKLNGGIPTWDGSSFSYIPLPEGCRRPVSLITDSNGNLYATFLTFKRSTSPVRKWNGNQWSQIGPPLDDVFKNFNAMAFDPEGNLYVAGSFKFINDIECNSIAKWNSTIWESLGSGLNNSANGIMWDSASNSLYTYGDFDTAGGIPAQCLARWDPTGWHALGMGLRDGSWIKPQVFSITPDGKGGLYVSGRFDTAGTIVVDGSAYWNGSEWDSAGTLLPGLAKWSSMICEPSGTLLFSNAKINGIACTAARWTGSTWIHLHPIDSTQWLSDFGLITADANGTLYAIASGNEFTMSVPLVWKDDCWKRMIPGGMDGLVNAITIDSDGSLIIAGAFTTVGGIRANRIARLRNDGWEPLGSGISDGLVCALSLDSAGGVIAAGTFNRIGEQVMNRIARWNGSSWSALEQGISNDRRFDSLVIHALVCGTDGTIYAGGIFDSAGGKYCRNIAAWKTNSWHSLCQGLHNGIFDAGVYALTLNENGALIAVGNFSSNHCSRSLRNVAQWNGSSWDSLTGYTSSTLHAITFDPEGKIATGGMDSRENLVGPKVWTGTEWNDLGLQTVLTIPINDPLDVRAMVFDDGGKLYCAGILPPKEDSLSVWGIRGGKSSIFMHSESGWRPLGSAFTEELFFDECVNTLFLHDSILYAGGEFAGGGGAFSPYFTAINLRGHQTAVSKSPTKPAQTTPRRTPAGKLLFSAHQKGQWIVELFTTSGRLICKKNIVVDHPGIQSLSLKPLAHRFTICRIHTPSGQITTSVLR